MEFKGTKGNWVRDGKNVIVKKSNGTSNLICECISKQFNSYHNTEEQAEANAKLISCAPEMLQKLIDIESFATLKPEYRKTIQELIQKSTT